MNHAPLVEPEEEEKGILFLLTKTEIRKRKRKRKGKGKKTLCPLVPLQREKKMGGTRGKKERQQKRNGTLETLENLIWIL